MNEGDWKIVQDNGDVLIKVVSFPVPKVDASCGTQLVSESMWVKKIKGTDNNGIGVLDNTPFFCEEVCLGDIIRYSGGTDKQKPRYVKKIDETDVLWESSFGG